MKSHIATAVLAAAVAGIVAGSVCSLVNDAGWMWFGIAFGAGILFGIGIAAKAWNVV